MTTERITFPGHSGDTLSARLDLPDGPHLATALFAHCFTCSKDIPAARRIAARLSAMGIAVLRFDFTGLGHSKGEFSNTTFTSNVQDLQAAADYLGSRGMSPSMLIGHSLGGVLSQMVRVQNKGVAGAVLLASSPMRAPLGVAWRMLRHHPMALIKSQLLGDFEAGLPAFISFFYGDNLDEDLKRKYISELCGESPRAMSELFRRPPPQTPDLDTRPVLVVAGRDDWSIPMPNHEWLAETFRAPLKVVPGAHNLMVDPAWAESAQAIGTWLDERFVRP